MKTDALIFDIDGTLWDSCEAVRASWQQSLRSRYGCFGSPSLEQVRSIMGLTPDEIADKLFSRFGAHAREVFDTLSEDECAYLAVHGAALYPGVSETLPLLAARVPLFIVSNCQKGYLEALFASTGFGAYFTDARSAGMTGLDKAGNLRALLREYAPESAVFVGDTRGDEDAARAAGCRFVHAAYGFGDAAAPDAVIHHFGELLSLLDNREEASHV